MLQLLSHVAQTSSDYNFDYDYTTTTTNTTDAATAAGLMAFLAAYFLFIMAIVVVSVVAMWKVFTKAGKPGWAALIPIYNTIVLLEVVGRPVWWVVLMFIPFVNIIIWLLIALDLAKAFGKSPAFGVVGLFFFNLIGMLMLAFGSAKYVGAPNNPNRPPASSTTAQA